MQLLRLGDPITSYTKAPAGSAATVASGSGLACPWIRPSWLSRAPPGLPIGRPIVFEELSPHVRAGVEAGDDRCDDAGGAVDAVERRMETLLGKVSRRDLRGIFVGDPSCVDAVHVDAVVVVV